MSLNAIYMGKVFEKFYPLVSSLLCFGVLWYANPFWVNFTMCKILSGPYLTIFSICFGFIFTSLSTLISLGDKIFIKNMKKIGSFDLLISYHKESLFWNILGTILGVVVLFWDEKLFIQWQGFVFISVGIGAISSSYRLFSLFFLVTSQINKS